MCVQSRTIMVKLLCHAKHCVVFFMLRSSCFLLIKNYLVHLLIHYSKSINEPFKNGYVPSKWLLQVVSIAVMIHNWNYIPGRMNWVLIRQLWIEEYSLLVMKKRTIILNHWSLKPKVLPEVWKCLLISYAY